LFAKIEAKNAIVVAIKSSNLTSEIRTAAAAHGNLITSSNGHFIWGARSVTDNGVPENVIRVLYGNGSSYSKKIRISVEQSHSPEICVLHLDESDSDCGICVQVKRSPDGE
jgi:hypothetical protein